MRKHIVAFILLTFIPQMSFAGPPKWKNICLKKEVPNYCKNVGEKALNNSKNPPALRGIELGKIVGVSWRPKGSVIDIEDAIPKLGLPKVVTKSPTDAYYYIIDGGIGDPFLRECLEIDAN